MGIIVFSWEISRWKKKIKVHVSFCIRILFSFWVLRKKKLFMSPVPPFSLSLVSPLLSLCAKNESTKEWMANVYGEEDSYSLQAFESFRLYSFK